VTQKFNTGSTAVKQFDIGRKGVSSFKLLDVPNADSFIGQQNVAYA
jgi:hypothetical protein